MSSDRARTPSPHKPSRVEPGVFSSLSNFQFYKPEERKSQAPPKPKVPLPVRPKSPVKVAVTVSPVRAKKAPSATSGPRTPERNRSPVLTRATTAQPSTDLTPPRGSDETSRLQDTIKKLTAQLTKEKKTSTALEQRLAEEESTHKQEQAKLRNDLVSIQQTIQKWKAQQHDKLSSELAAAKASMDGARTHIKALVGVFVSVLEQFLVRNFYSDELMVDAIEEERLFALESIQKLLVSRLEMVASGTGTDLDSEIAGVRGWTPKPTYQLPKQMAKNQTQARPPPAADSFSYEAEEEKPFPQISYSVEFFPEDSSAEAEPEALHPLNPLRILDENRTKTQSDDRASEVDQLKMRIMSRIKGRTDDMGLKTSDPEFAVAQYAFEGERVSGMQDGDLSFDQGDVIEIIKKDESGWWVGRKGSTEGLFPYNFVQISQ